MYLLIDVGNTRVKWQLIERQYDNGAAIHYGDLSELKLVLGTLDNARTKVLIASVNQTQPLMKLLKEESFDNIFIAKAEAFQQGVHNSYEFPEKMGVDRWLAMIAAYSTKEYRDKAGIIVVDAGSALTIDVVSGNGQHKGGYIVPGLEMAQRALFYGTEQIIQHQENARSMSAFNDGINKLGNNTDQCVKYGVVNQLTALVHSVSNQYSDYGIVITGGDGEALAQFFPTMFVDKNLVLKGLWQVGN